MEVSFFCVRTTERKVRKMIMNLIVFWILMSLFFGSRAAGRAFGFLFGIMALIWVVGILAGFGLMLLCVLRRRADTGAFASGHSAATTDSTLISHFAFNHNDVMFRHSLE